MFNGSPSIVCRRRLWLGIACLAWVLAFAATAPTASAIVRTNPQMRKDPVNDPFAGDPGLPWITSAWGGGAHSLPYNMYSSWQELVAYSQTLRSVQIAIGEFQRRGYVRRADRDTAGTDVGYSTAILCFEKPGVPFEDLQATIVVRSFAVQRFIDHWYPVTMVFGKVTRDSLASDSVHVAVLVTDPADEPFTMRWIPGEAGQAETESFGYSEWEGIGVENGAIGTRLELVDPQMMVLVRSMSAQERKWIEDYTATLNLTILGALVNTAVSACKGLVKGRAGAIKGAAEGIVIGCIAVSAAHHAYLATHPFPAQVKPKQ